MAASSKITLSLCPCLSPSRWLRSGSRLFSSRQWTDSGSQRAAASASVRPKTRTSLSGTKGVRNGATGRSECNGGVWRSSFMQSFLGLGLRSESYLLAGRGRFCAIGIATARFNARSCAMVTTAREGHGESDSPYPSPATSLISPIVEEPAVSELPNPSPDAARSPKSSKKRMCYYFSQGLCTLMEDDVHMSKFSHEFPDMSVRADDVVKVKPQPFSYFLVLDLEGMVEILEFPVLMLDAKTLQVVDRFHRFVRPCKMKEERIDDYIRNKYAKWGLDRVWHDTAIPFRDVLQAFEGWLERHGLFDRENPSKLTSAAFVTCGNWDVKTKIPEQCVTSEIELPVYFNEWINLKDIYFNFYKSRAGGMLAMMKGLKMPMLGTHHVGLDDAHNIARVLQRMLSHGSIMHITAKRTADDPKTVKFTFRFRIK